MQRKRILKVNLEDEIKSFDDMIESFILFKRAQGISERTIRDYNTTFKAFKYLSNITEFKITDVKENLLQFFSKKSQNAPATYNIPYSNLNAFFNWAINEGYIDENPIKALGLKKKRDEGRIRHIEEDVIKKLLEAIDLTTYAGLRDYVTIILTLDTGIRPKEAFSLRISDIDFTHNLLTIRKEIAKTRTARILPLSPQTIEVIKKLISVKLPEWEDYVLHTNEGLPMGIDRWEKRMKNYSKIINHKIAPYDLRHTFAIMFLRNNGNVFALQHELGHTDITMTKRYVRLAQSDIKEQHSIASPVNVFVKRTTRIQKLFK